MFSYVAWGVLPLMPNVHDGHRVLRTPGEHNICFGAPAAARQREYILTYVVQNITTNINQTPQLTHFTYPWQYLHSTCLKTNTATVWVYAWKNGVHIGGAKHKNHHKNNTFLTHPRKSGTPRAALRSCMKKRSTHFTCAKHHRHPPTPIHAPV